jgi:hypothetical protein
MSPVVKPATTNRQRRPDEKLQRLQPKPQRLQLKQGGGVRRHEVGRLRGVCPDLEIHGRGMVSGVV